MIFLIYLGISFLFLIFTIAIFATKFFYPYHRLVAISVYLLGWIPFLYSMYLRKAYILKYKGEIVSIISSFWMYFVFLAFLLLLLYIFLVIFPLQKSQFSGMNDQAIAKTIEEEKTILLYLDNSLNTLVNFATGRGLLELDFKTVSEQEINELRKFWISYLEVFFELDILKNSYKTFYQLNVIKQKDLHIDAFYTGYTALVSQYYHISRLHELIKDDRVEKFLNENIEESFITANTYDLLSDKLTDINVLLRLNTGRAYKKIVNSRDDKISAKLNEYLDLIDSRLGEHVYLIAKKPIYFFERKSFDLWFPLQKKVVKEISYIKTSSRPCHIDVAQINDFKERLLPGDIMLERREWHATNIGIPGFWTHAALYVGSLDYLNKYFAGLDILEAKSFGEYLQSEYPSEYELFAKKDSAGYSNAVIEAKRPGVIFSSLEKSANADSLAILRTKNLEREQQLDIVMKAFSHIGKDYDYDFDFTTDNYLVCSELVYRAYIDVDQLNINPGELNGRLMYSPNDFAKKFADEYRLENRELELVIFLDGNEKTKQAVEKDQAEFAKSHERSKWHLAVDFVTD